MCITCIKWVKHLTKTCQILSKKLNEKIVEIEAGKLELSDLESVVEYSREIYERLLILKHKAYEQLEKTAAEEVQDEIIKEEPVEKVAEIEQDEDDSSLDFSGITEENEGDQEEQPSFDFTASEETESVEETGSSTAEITVEESTENETALANDSDDNEDIFKDSHVEKHEPEDKNTLNEKLKEDDELSLRKKLQSTAVLDLKAEISIAKKFEYITFMFEGKNESYNDAIDVLNNCADGDDARVKLNEYSSKYDWDLENKSIIKFVELVERRYL